MGLIHKKEETLNTRIQKLRKEKGFTQAELASQLNITDKAVSKWESGEGNPDISILPKIALIFGVSVDYLLTGKETEEKIIVTSKYELCAKNDDPSYLSQIKNLGALDEDGNSLFDLIYKYGSAKVFNQILLDKRQIELIGSSGRSGNNANRYVKEIIYLFLISNNLDKHSAFQFNDIAFADKKEWSERAMDALLNDPRVSQDTLKKVFSSHLSTESRFEPGYGNYQGIGNWQEIYPMILDYAISKGYEDKISYILDLIGSLNKECAIAKEANPKSVISFKRDVYRNPYSPTTYVFATQVNKETMDSLLSKHSFELLNRCIEINRKVGGYVPSEKEVKLETMKTEKGHSADEIFVFSCIDDGILNIKKLLESLDFKLIKATLYSHPIHYYEYLKVIFDKKDYKTLFRFGVDHKISGLANAALAKNDTEIGKMIEAVSFRQSQSSLPFTNVEFFVKYNPQNYRYQGCREYIGTADFVKSLKGIRDGIINDLSLKLDKNELTKGLTKEYFEDLIEKGNIEMVVIKLCVKLEAILKCDYKMVGTFEEMLTKYCSGFNTTDDESNDYDPRTPSLLHRLRIKRNNIVHSEKNEVDFTTDDVRQCLSYIFSIDKE